MVVRISALVYCYFFFFQAEDGIRDLTVTGVQTCALPISWRLCRNRRGADVSPRRLHLDRTLIPGILPAQGKVSRQGRPRRGGPLRRNQRPRRAGSDVRQHWAAAPAAA